MMFAFFFECCLLAKHKAAFLLINLATHYLVNLKKSSLK